MGSKAKHERRRQRQGGAVPEGWRAHTFEDARIARAAHSATVVGKHVYVCGGRRG